jgi:hypothetical protein
VALKEVLRWLETNCDESYGGILLDVACAHNNELGVVITSNPWQMDGDFRLANHDSGGVIAARKHGSPDLAVISRNFYSFDCTS